MALFDFKGFFNNNKEGYSSEAQNAKSLNDKRVEFNQQESVSAAEKRIIGSILASEEGGLSSLLDLLSGKGNDSQGGASGTFNGDLTLTLWKNTLPADVTNSLVNFAVNDLKVPPSYLITKLHYEGLWGGSSVAKSNNNWGGMTWNNSWSSPKQRDSGIAVTKGTARPSNEGGHYIKYASVNDFLKDWTYLIRIGGNYNIGNSATFEEAVKGAFQVGGAKNDYATMNVSGSQKRYELYLSQMSARRKQINDANNQVLDSLDSGGHAGFSGAGGGATGSFVNPSEGVLTSPYGMRTHPVSGKRKMHKGIDVAGSGNTLVAANAGTVEFARNGHNGGFGNYLKINHGTINGVKIDTIYAHLASISVSSGQSVTKGQKIGIRGTTGTSTGIHLHFEVHENGNHVDPLKYVKY